jgi:hypothetical protein
MSVGWNPSGTLNGIQDEPVQRSRACESPEVLSWAATQTFDADVAEAAWSR